MAATAESGCRDVGWLARALEEAEISSSRAWERGDNLHRALYLALLRCSLALNMHLFQFPFWRKGRQVKVSFCLSHQHLDLQGNSCTCLPLVHLPSSHRGSLFTQGMVVPWGAKWFTVPVPIVCQAPAVPAGGIERFNLTKTMKTTTWSKATSAV